MDPRLVSGLVPENYARQGCEALAKRQKLVTSLLSERRLPAQGWDAASIERLLQDIAAMDSNNFLGTAGVGEREARIACPLVAARHFHLAHGIGRSGDVAAPQPKAAGSSLLQQLTCLLAADALRLAGLPELGAVTVLPVATGLAITLTLLALRTTQADRQARLVLWPRIDQKTCLKAIVSAGFEAVPIENRLEGDEVRTDLAALEAEIERYGASAIAAVCTTTSCFAPRGPDRIVEVAKLCSRHGIPHIINNAYGVQSAALCQLVTAACRKGRVDAFIQSTDKNFMVPVGGAIVASPRGNTALVEAVNKVYPGRASASPSLDLFMTLLHWGAEGWLGMLRQREAIYPVLLSRLREFAERNGERVLATPSNPISIGVTLQRLSQSSGPADKGPSFLGSMLYKRSVSGARVVAPGKQQQVAGHEFADYGAHIDRYPVPYLTAAAALGTTEEDVNQFISKLEACYRKLAVADQKHEARSGAAWQTASDD